MFYASRLGHRGYARAAEKQVQLHRGKQTYQEGMGNFFTAGRIPADIRQPTDTPESPAQDGNTLLRDRITPPGDPRFAALSLAGAASFPKTHFLPAPATSFCTGSDRTVFICGDDMSTTGGRNASRAFAQATSLLI